MSVVVRIASIRASELFSPKEEQAPAEPLPRRTPWSHTVNVGSEVILGLRGVLRQGALGDPDFNRSAS